MAVSREWTEWHLTTVGWVRGSWVTDFKSDTTVETPENCVLTCKYREEISSSHGGGGSDAEVTWHSEKNELIEQLKKKFGECPSHL